MGRRLACGRPPACLRAPATGGAGPGGGERLPSLRTYLMTVRRRSASGRPARSDRVLRRIRSPPRRDSDRDGDLGHSLFWKGRPECCDPGPPRRHRRRNDHRIRSNRVLAGPSPLSGVFVSSTTDWQSRPPGRLDRTPRPVRHPKLSAAPARQVRGRVHRDERSTRGRLPARPRGRPGTRPHAGPIPERWSSPTRPAR